MCVVVVVVVGTCNQLRVISINIYTEVKSCPCCSEILRNHLGLGIISVLGFIFYFFF